MGNTSAIFRKNGMITIKEISKTLDEINDEFFDNKLPIKVYNDSIQILNDDIGAINWWFNDKPYIKYSYDEDTEKEIGEKVSDNFLEYRDVLRLSVSDWLQDVLTKELSYRLKLENYCMAIDENMTEPYAKSFEEYILRTNISGFKKFILTPFLKNLYKENLKRAEKIYPEEFYEYLSNKKFKL